MLLGLELVDYKLLQGGGLCSSLCVALVYFLGQQAGVSTGRVAYLEAAGSDVVRTVMLPFMSFLTREKVVGPRRSGSRAVSFRVRVSLAGWREEAACRRWESETRRPR